MRLIGLNCWGGHEFEALMEFIRENKDTTDIFCFQEVFKTESDLKEYQSVRVNLFEEMREVLEGFSSSYTPITINASTYDKVDFDLKYGLVIFYRSRFTKVWEETRGVFSFQIPESDQNKVEGTIKVQVVDLKIDGVDLCVINFHGVYFPKDKLDSELRLKQSKAILEILEKKKGEVIVCGDFNLLPVTESIKMLNEKLRNLISEFNITQTRSVLTGYRGKPDEQFFADYTFVSNGIKVKSFEVPDIIISDHLPMILEFEI